MQAGLTPELIAENPGWAAACSTQAGPCGPLVSRDVAIRARAVAPSASQTVRFVPMCCMAPGVAQRTYRRVSQRGWQTGLTRGKHSQLRA